MNSKCTVGSISISPPCLAFEFPTMGTSINHPYFSPDELAFLSERQRGKMSETHETKARNQACSFIEVVSTKIGL